MDLITVKQMKFFLFSGFLSGPSQSSLWPGHVQQRHLQLADQVDHGRWSSSSSIKSQLRVQLRLHDHWYELTFQQNIWQNIVSLSAIVGDFLPREIENYPAIFEASQWGDVTEAGSGLASLHSVKVSLTVIIIYFPPHLTSQQSLPSVWPWGSDISAPSQPLLFSLINENRNCLLLLLLQSPVPLLTADIPWLRLHYNLAALSLSLSLNVDCLEINCGSPGVLPNGWLEGSRTTLHAVVTFRSNIYFF